MSDQNTNIPTQAGHLAAFPPALGSAPQWVVLVGYPRESMAGKYLEGPRDPKTVKRHGYGFTAEVAKAWPFASEKAAKAKALIIDRHMGWGEGVMIVEPRPCCDKWAEETRYKPGGAGIDRLKDGTWGIADDGSYVLAGIRFCPFCGAVVSPQNTEATNAGLSKT